VSGFQAHPQICYKPAGWGPSAPPGWKSWVGKEKLLQFQVLVGFVGGAVDSGRKQQPALGL
jgi:hypothetical protein